MTYLAIALALWLTATPGQDDGCRLHIELLSPKELAVEYGTTEAWILRNHQIYLWERQTTPRGKGRVVGQLLPGSRALIIEDGPEDYKVRSPLDKSIGWVNKIQVKRTLYLDTETFEVCTPSRHTVAPRRDR